MYGNQGYGQQGSYGGQQYGNQGYGQRGPPQVPPPWIAEWDPSQNRYIFINRETGQRTHEFPQQSYGGQGYGSGYGGGGYEQRGQGGYGQQGGYGYEQRGQGGYNEPPPQHKSHTGRNVALAGIAGLAGGALLMHEGEKVRT